MKISKRKLVASNVLSMAMGACLVIFFSETTAPVNDKVELASSPEFATGNSAGSWDAIPPGPDKTVLDKVIDKLR